MLAVPNQRKGYKHSVDKKRDSVVDDIEFDQISSCSISLKSKIWDKRTKYVEDARHGQFRSCQICDQLWLGEKVKDKKVTKWEAQRGKQEQMVQVLVISLPGRSLQLHLE